MAAALDDRSLVRAAQAGDRDAMDQLLRRHFDRIHAVCRRITGNEADAADAAQEALIAVVRGLQRFDGRSAFSTWVYRVATNASLDELRRRRRRPIASVDRDHHDPHDDHAPRHTEPADPTAERPIDMVAERMATETALAGLAEEFRIPVVLRDVADLDYAEIAEILGVPIGTVKSRIARGRGMLASALGRAGNRSGAHERPTDAS